MNPNTQYITPIGPQFSVLNLDPEMRFLGQAVSPLIIGLTGPTKVGKTQVAKMLVTDLGFEYAGLSAVVKRLSMRLGMKDANWEGIGKLADDLRKGYSKDYLARQTDMYIRRSFRNKKRIVIDGILHPAELNYFQTIYENFKLVSLNASLTLRITTAKEWGVANPSDEINGRDLREQLFVQREDLFAPNLMECMKNCQTIIVEDFTIKYFHDDILDKLAKLID
jgi:hypothetical protein